MLTSIIKACSSTAALEVLKKTKSPSINSQPQELQSLLDLVGSLSLSHFGTVSESRRIYSVLPDSLAELEKWHPTRTPFGFDASLFPAPDAPISAAEGIINGKSELISNMLTVYEDPEQRYVMQVFFLPKGCVMPLHDHPQMAVISKLLIGSIDIASYSYKHIPSSPGRSRTYGREVVPSGRHTLSLDDKDTSLSILLPDIGNLHAMRALEHSMFFDILSPPYRPPVTDCTYYMLRRVSQDNGESIEIETEAETVHSLYPVEENNSFSFFVSPFDPPRFQCLESEYKGPKIIL
jgi:hypothetical protein